LLVQDPVVCRFTESKLCYVALGQQLHLQMPLEDAFNLKITDKTFADHIILKYRKSQSNPPTPHIPGWQFVNDNKTLILTSAERNNSGTYTLETFDAGGERKDSYTLQLKIKGLLAQDPVFCRFTESNQCYVALGQQLHLQMPLEDAFNLKITDKTFADHIILKYRKSQSNPPTPHIPGWQFVNDNKTLILTSAERNNSGAYFLETFDANGTSKGIYTLHLNIKEGSLDQDPVVCRFTESNNQCSVALGQQLHLQILLEDAFNLRFTDMPFTARTILKYRKTQSNPPTPNIPGWQFVNDNKTMILTSAERNNSGTYTVDTYDANGSSKGSYTLQLNIE
ncbi:carcinoembryonic antigen-related cell adhesion molecule 5-like isoform X1, partial [Clarias magur]